MFRQRRTLCKCAREGFGHYTSVLVQLWPSTHLSRQTLFLSYEHDLVQMVQNSFAQWSWSNQLVTTASFRLCVKFFPVCEELWSFPVHVWLLTFTNSRYWPQNSEAWWTYAIPVHARGHVMQWRCIVPLVQTANNVTRIRNHLVSMLLSELNWMYTWSQIPSGLMGTEIFGDYWWLWTSSWTGVCERHVALQLVFSL